MITLVLSSRKDNIPIEIPTTYKVERSILSTVKPIIHHNATSVSMSAKSTDMNYLLYPEFLSSPVETILESISDPGMDSITLHDLIEAYSILSGRVRSQAKNLVHEKNLPAVGPLRDHSSSLTHALKRDLRRVLLDPTSHTQESTFMDAATLAWDIQHAQDIGALCLHALCFLSDVFAFRALYSVFSKNELHELLETLLQLALVDDIASPSRMKTWSFVTWILQTQDLPSIILEHKKSNIVSALKRSIEGELGSYARLDGLKAVSRLLTHQTKLFIMPFVEILPSILDCLIADSTDCRMNAAIALNSFALVKISSIKTCEYPSDKIVDVIQSFIHSQSSVGDDSQEEPSLSSIIKASLLGGTSPTWAVTTLAALTVLLDFSLFLHSSSIKFCLNHLAFVASHEYSDVAALHPHIWRILIWGYLRIPHDVGIEQGHVSHRKSTKNLRVSAYKVVAQVLKGGVATALVSALLGPNDATTNSSVASNDVSKALDVVGSMVTGKLGSDPEEGLVLLSRLVSAIGTPSSSQTVPVEEWEKNHSPPVGLLDGTVLHSTLKGLGKTVRKMEVVKIDRVRQLSETEIVTNWDNLIAIWTNSAKDALGKPNFYCWDELVYIWQSLLLARADPPDRDGYLTASSVLAERVASIVTQFLPIGPSGATLSHLVLLQKLWDVMKNVFSSSWLQSPAENILAAVLMRHFSLHDTTIKEAWSVLCASLISVGIPSVLHVISCRSDFGQGLEVTRQLWTIIAKAWQTSSERMYWGNMVAFLAIPYRWGLSMAIIPVNDDIVGSAWELSNTELELWNGVLLSAIASAEAASVGPIDVITSFLRRIGRDGMERLSSAPKTILSILSHIDISVCDHFPLEIFSLVDLALVSHYSSSKSELRPIMVEILHLLGKIIAVISPPTLIQLISATERGLCLWIKDIEEILTQTQHDNLVTDVYCCALAILRRQEPTLNTLLAVSSFLTSGFGRLHTPLIGPLAFQDFWRATYHNIEDFKSHYSESLRNCLLAFSDTWGGSLGDNLSNYSESQKTKMSTIPDSQPTRYNAQGSWGYSTQFPPDLRASQDPEPVMKKRKLDHTNYLAAPEELQRYSSYLGNRSGTQSIGLPEHDKHGASERPTKSNALLSSKRGQVEVNHTADYDARDIDSSRSNELDRDSNDRPKHKTTRSRSIIPYHPYNNDSQDIDNRKRKRILDWVSARGSPESYPPWSDKSPSKTPEKVQQNRAGGRSTTPMNLSSPEDYNSWEAGVSIEELRKLQHELSGSDHSFHETEMEVENELDGDRTDILSDQHKFSPPLGELPNRPLHQLRSQTSPGSIPTRSLPRPDPIRRHRTTSTRLDIDNLLRTYAAVEDDASQAPVTDLVHATALINKIGTKLNEHLSRRLTGQGPLPD